MQIEISLKKVVPFPLETGDVLLIDHLHRTGGGLIFASGKHEPGLDYRDSVYLDLKKFTKIAITGGIKSAVNF